MKYDNSTKILKTIIFSMVSTFKLKYFVPISKIGPCAFFCFPRSLLRCNCFFYSSFEILIFSRINFKLFLEKHSSQQFVISQKDVRPHLGPTQERLLACFRPNRLGQDDLWVRHDLFTENKVTNVLQKVRFQS